MNQDELNTLKSLQATFANAFAQTDLFWMKEIMASGMISLDALVVRSTKNNEPVGDTPCPECNANGVFNYSPAKDCICGGKAWMFKKQLPIPKNNTTKKSRKIYTQKDGGLLK